MLGMPGISAYIGLTRFAEVKEGDTAFVSGAAGTVAGQIAKLQGAARVIGSAGSDDKVKLLTEEYGYDAAFNYKNGLGAEQLAQAAPDGIDVFFATSAANTSKRRSARSSSTPGSCCLEWSRSTTTSRCRRAQPLEHVRHPVEDAGVRRRRCGRSHRPDRHHPGGSSSGG